LDNNTSVKSVEIGPKNFVREDHEVILSGPDKMITLSEFTYVCIEDPIVLDNNKEAKKNKDNQYMYDVGQLQ
jgi:major vault protein